MDSHRRKLLQALPMLALTSATLGACSDAPMPDPPPNTVDDITRLNPIKVERIAEPTTVEEVEQLVAGHAGPICIGGGRFSQGGQTAYPGALFLDMRKMNRIVALDEAARTLTVEVGATWRQIREAIDPKNLSLKIMQSFSNFTVGGSLGVNCHGDYVGHGPLVESVRALRIVLADGSVKTASRTENRDIFQTAIGGYGGIGVIVDTTLDLAENTALDRVTHYMSADEYPAWHRTNIEARDDVVLHHAVIYPRAYKNIAAEVSTRTDKPVTVQERLAPLGQPGSIKRGLLDFVTFSPFGPSMHESIYDPLTADRPAVVWRNFEAAQDVYSLEPASRLRSTYALQEYFVPADRFAPFVAAMKRVLNLHGANVLNVAIRHTRADAETLLAWAKTDVWSFVLYYEQGTSDGAKRKVGVWTRALADAALEQGGTWYLPYQIHATRDQFLAAYPRAQHFFAAKARLDPGYKFRNKLWEAYLRP